MKKVLLGLLGLGLLVPAFAFAADFRSGQSQSLTSSDVVSDDLYLFGGTIVDSGIVHGDLIAAGGTLLVTGAVDGTLQAAGGNISFTGAVGQTIRAAGGSIVINSTVGKDIVVAGGSVQIDSKVGRDVWASGGTVTINGPIAGKLEVNAQKIIIGSKAVINGTFTYRSPIEAQIDPAAKIIGQVKYIPTASPSKKDVGAIIAGFFTLWLIVKFLMSLIIGLLLVWLMRRYATQLTVRAFANPLLEFAVGLAATILFPIISILLCVTIIGIPLGVMGILSYIILLILSSIIAPLLLGSLLYKWTMRGTSYEMTWKTVVLGVVVYSLLTLIPIVGWLIKFIFFPLAFGVILKEKWAIIKTLR